VKTADQQFRNRTEGAPRDGCDRRRAAATAGPAAAAALGTTAKFRASPFHGPSGAIDPSLVDAETGEIRQDRTPAEIRVERYALQSVVRHLLPKSRTAHCLRSIQNQRASVDVFRSLKYQRAHYGGLQTCASVWACPVCSAKISERRRADLGDLIARHESAGGVVLLITRTVPHKRADDLGELLAAISKAESSYKWHRDYKTLMQAFGLVGTVRAVEVTHGEANGWHPHVHELVFLREEAVIEDLEEALSHIWQGAALRAGLALPSRAHGLTVQDGSQAAKYASKWGLESELTQWHRKRGKVESCTPFDLLRAVLAGGEGAARAGHLFREYAEAFHGRHQLQFSRGLKARYAVEDLSDEDLTHRQDDDAQLLGAIGLDDWRNVCRSNQRGALLEVAAVGGWSAVELLLDGLRATSAAYSHPGGWGRSAPYRPGASPS
jgi:hypothetical protein